MIGIKYLDRNSKNYLPITDNKYVDQGNPFRSEKLLDSLQQLMEILRTEKIIFDRIPDTVSEADRHDYINKDGMILVSSTESDIEKSIETNKAKSKVLEHYKLWVLVKLYYQDTKNSDETRKYVDYETLLKTPCSSMFSYPLKEADLTYGLESLASERYVQAKPTRELTADEMFDAPSYQTNRHFRRKGSSKFYTSLSSDNPKITKDSSFALTIDGNLHVLYMLNAVLKFDNYETARGKLDGVIIHSFIDTVLRKMKMGDNDIKDFCLKHFLTNFEVFVKLQEYFSQ